MLRRHSYAGLLLAGLLLSALPTAAFAQSPASGPEGIDWKLIQVAGSGVPIIDVPPGVDATLRIDGAQAGGKGGCNQWFSEVKIDGASIVFGGIGSTMMACEEPAMGFESQYLHLLGEVQRWAIADGTLTLTDANDAMLLVFAGGGASGTLEGVDWRVSQLLMDGALAAVPADIDITLTLADGQASGSGGCNSASGGYKLDGASLTFGPMAATEMACPEPRMQLESAWFTTLGVVTGWRMDGSQLLLTDATGTTVAVLDPLQALSPVGTWTLAEIADGSGRLVLVDSDATLEFGADGSLGGNTGCNSLHSDYVVEGASIKVGPVATTKMACRDADASAVESQLLAALEGATIWSINVEGWLELSDSEGQLLAGFTPGAPAAG